MRMGKTKHTQEVLDLEGERSSIELTDEEEYANEANHMNRHSSQAQQENRQEALSTGAAVRGSQENTVNRDKPGARKNVINRDKRVARDNIDRGPWDARDYHDDRDEAGGMENAEASQMQGGGRWSKGQDSQAECAWSLREEPRAGNSKSNTWRTEADHESLRRSDGQTEDRRTDHEEPCEQHALDHERSLEWMSSTDSGWEDARDEDLVIRVYRHAHDFDNAAPFSRVNEGAGRQQVSRKQGQCLERRREDELAKPCDRHDDDELSRDERARDRKDIHRRRVNGVSRRYNDGGSDECYDERAQEGKNRSDTVLRHGNGYGDLDGERIRDRQDRQMQVGHASRDGHDRHDRIETREAKFGHGDFEAERGAQAATRGEHKHQHEPSALARHDRGVRDDGAGRGNLHRDLQSRHMPPHALHDDDYKDDDDNNNNGHDDDDDDYDDDYDDESGNSKNVEYRDTRGRHYDGSARLRHYNVHDKYDYVQNSHDAHRDPRYDSRDNSAKLRYGSLHERDTRAKNGEKTTGSSDRDRDARLQEVRKGAGRGCYENCKLTSDMEYEDSDGDTQQAMTRACHQHRDEQGMRGRRTGGNTTADRHEHKGSGTMASQRVNTTYNSGQTDWHGDVSAIMLSSPSSSAESESESESEGTAYQSPHIVSPDASSPRARY